MVSPSDYLQPHTANQLAEIKKADSQLGHFQFVLEEGQIDIVAGQFIGSVLETVPFIGSQADEIRNLTSQQTLAEGAVDIRCAFCGRERVEVSHIITGPEANICGDCVVICVDLIKPPSEGK